MTIPGPTKSLPLIQGYRLFWKQRSAKLEKMRKKENRRNQALAQIIVLETARKTRSLAAVRIQSVWRGYKVRKLNKIGKKVEDEIKNVAVIEAPVLAPTNYVEISDLTLDSLTSDQQASKDNDSLNWAIKLQSTCRSWVLSTTLKRELATKARVDHFAINLQKFSRGVVARDRFILMRNESRARAWRSKPVFTNPLFKATSQAHTQQDFDMMANIFKGWRLVDHPNHMTNNPLVWAKKQWWVTNEQAEMTLNHRLLYDIMPRGNDFMSCLLRAPPVLFSVAEFDLTKIKVNDNIGITVPTHMPQGLYQFKPLNDESTCALWEIVPFPQQDQWFGSYIFSLNSARREFVARKKDWGVKPLSKEMLNLLDIDPPFIDTPPLIPIPISTGVVNNQCLNPFAKAFEPSLNTKKETKVDYPLNPWFARLEVAQEPVMGPQVCACGSLFTKKRVYLDKQRVCSTCVSRAKADRNRANQLGLEWTGPSITFDPGSYL